MTHTVDIVAAHTLGVEERFVSVEEYLRTSYRPDCDYVEGRVEERNAEEWEHAAAQKTLMRIFLANEERRDVSVIQECRLQVAENRFLAPIHDFACRAEAPSHGTGGTVDLNRSNSPEDRQGRLQGVLGDHLAMRVEHIWHSPRNNDRNIGSRPGFSCGDGSVYGRTDVLGAECR